MKTMARIFTILLLALALAVPQASADHRTSGNRGHHRTEQQSNRHHGGNSRPSKDSYKSDKHSKNDRSDKYSKHDKHNKHDKYDRHDRYDRHDKYRPSGKYHGNHSYGRPVAVHDNGNHYGHYKRPHAIKPPHRPYRPIPGPWRRPVRPHYWRPAPHAPMLSTMLGVAFGTAINLAINQLVNNGYNVSGYNSNTVYLVDVNQAGYMWPDATFYYDGGYLDRSEFFYTSPYPDTYRYTMLYNSFTNNYGMPVNVVNTPAAMSATWFAPDRGYITLQYGNGMSMAVPGRFVTTLTVGI